MFRLTSESFNIRKIITRKNYKLFQFRNLETQAHENIIEQKYGFKKINDIQSEYYNLHGHSFQHLVTNTPYYHFSSQREENYFGISFKTPHDDVLSQLLNIIIFESLEFSQKMTNFNAYFGKSLISKISCKHSLDHVTVCFSAENPVLLYQNIELLSEILNNEDFLLHSLKTLQSKKNRIIKQYLELRNDLNVAIPYVFPNYCKLGQNNYFNQTITLPTLLEYFKKYINYYNACICTLGNISMDEILPLLNNQILAQSSKTVSIVTPYKQSETKEKYIEIKDTIVHSADMHKSQLCLFKLQNDRSLLFSLDILDYMIHYLPPYVFPAHLISAKYCISSSPSNGVCRQTNPPLFCIGLYGSNINELTNFETAMDNLLLNIKKHKFVETGITAVAAEKLMSEYLRSFLNRKSTFINNVFDLWCNGSNVLENIFSISYLNKLNEEVIKNPSIFYNYIDSALVKNADKALISLKYEAPDENRAQDPVKNISIIIDNLHSQAPSYLLSAPKSASNIKFQIDQNPINGSFITKMDIKSTTKKINSGVEANLLLTENYPFTHFNLFISAMTLTETKSYLLKIECMKRQLLMNKSIAYADVSIHSFLKAINTLNIIPTVSINSKDSIYDGGIFLSCSCSHSNIGIMFNLLSSFIEKTDQKIMKDPKFAIISFMPQLTQFSYLYSPQFLIPYTAAGLHFSEYINSVYNGFNQCQFLINLSNSRKNTTSNITKEIFLSNKIQCSVLTDPAYAEKVERNLNYLFEFRKPAPKNEITRNAFSGDLRPKILKMDSKIKIFIRSYLCPSEGELERLHIMVAVELLSLYFQTFKNKSMDWMNPILSHKTLNFFFNTISYDEKDFSSMVDEAINWVNSEKFNQAQFKCAQINALRSFSTNYTHENISSYCLLNHQDENQVFDNLKNIQNITIDDIVIVSRKYLTGTYTHLYLGP